ncbi:MAG: hypothetical protein OHK0022_55370 [Roseiflexaceae bacterium]
MQAPFFLGCGIVKFVDQIVCEEECPGAVVFTLGGQEYRLDAASLSAHGLFLVFRDQTSGNETYGAARFLSTPPPQDGLVTLDFNRAVHPPCAFTEFATCPLPPRQNHLPVRIAAGERLG